jgi:hypothetical protein
MLECWCWRGTQLAIKAAFPGDLRSISDTNKGAYHHLLLQFQGIQDLCTLLTEPSLWPLDLLFNMCAYVCLLHTHAHTHTHAHAHEHTYTTHKLTHAYVFVLQILELNPVHPHGAQGHDSKFPSFPSEKGKLRRVSPHGRKSFSGAEWFKV